jgi:hypothetical protein
MIVNIEEKINYNSLFKEIIHFLSIQHIGKQKKEENKKSLKNYSTLTPFC